MTRIRRWVAAAAAGLVASAGCGLLPPQPVPFIPFGDFSLTTTGGVAGIYRQLRIGADGAGLVLSDEPAAGRVGAATMDRLRTLLESEALRRDISRLRDDTGPQRCADVFDTTLRMGELTAVRSDGCNRVPTPALDELGEIVQPFWEGDFEEPPPDGPAAPPIVIEEVEDGQATGQRIELAAGRATLLADGRKLRTADLDVRELEALPVLASAQPCRVERSRADGYRVRLGDRPAEAVISGRIGPECSELSAIVAIAVDAVDA